MKRTNLMYLFVLLTAVMISCTMDSTVKEIIGVGNFAFSDIKGSYQLYTEDGNLDTIYGNATYISDDGISTEVALSGIVNSDGTFSITEDAARSASGLTTDVTIEGDLSSGLYVLTTIKDENNVVGALTFDLDPSSIVVNSKGYEAWEMDFSDLYKDHSDGSSGPDPVEGVNATFVQNYSSVATISPENGTATMISVYDNGDGTYDYVKQTGDYDKLTRTVTAHNPDRYSAPEMDEGEDLDNDGVADCFIATFVLAGTITATFPADFSSMDMPLFWSGWSWNYSEGTVIYSNN